MDCGERAIRKYGRDIGSALDVEADWSGEGLQEVCCDVLIDRKT